MRIHSLSVAALAVFAFGANCVKSDLDDPVGQIRRLVNRYTPAIFPTRVAMPAPRTVQNYTDTSDEAQDGIANAMKTQVISANATASQAQVYLKGALDAVTERNQQLSLEVMLLDKAWNGLIFYCRYYNSGSDGTAIGSLTTTTSPSNTSRTNNWTNCVVPESAINAEIDQDLIALVKENMGGDDISDADKNELNALDGKSVSLQEMKITRYGGSTATNQTSGTDNGYAYRVEYNYSDAANKRIIRSNAARTQMDITDYETHTNSDGSKFESKSHFNTINESDSSGKQISQLQLNIKEGKENYVLSVTMQQWDANSSLNGTYVQMAYEQNGSGENYQVFAQGALDDSGGYAVAKYTEMTSTFTGGAFGSDFYLAVSTSTTCSSADWDDAIGYYSGGTRVFWGGANVTTARFCQVTLDEDGNITASTTFLASQAITVTVSNSAPTTYHETFDSSGNVTAQSTTSASSDITASSYYTAFQAAQSGGNIAFSDDTDVTTSGLLTSNRSDWVVVVGTTCPAIASWSDTAIGYGKWDGINSDNTASSFKITYWGTANQRGSGNNVICNLDTDAAGVLRVTANNGVAAFIP